MEQAVMSDLTDDELISIERSLGGPRSSLDKP